MVSLLLQNADSGGQFEYAPYVRCDKAGGDSEGKFDRVPADGGTQVAALNAEKAEEEAEREGYERLRRIFDEEPGTFEARPEQPGTFVLFKGRRSPHRVSRVGPTAQPRLIALFSYDHQPGMTFTQASQDFMRNPPKGPVPYLGAKTPPNAKVLPVEWHPARRGGTCSGGEAHCGAATNGRLARASRL